MKSWHDLIEEKLALARQQMSRASSLKGHDIERLELAKNLIQEAIDLCKRSDA